MRAHLLVRNALLAGPPERHRDVEEILAGAAIPEQSAEHGLARCARQGTKGRPEPLGGRVTRRHAASPPCRDRSMSGPPARWLHGRGSTLGIDRRPSGAPRRASCRCHAPRSFRSQERRNDRTIDFARLTVLAWLGAP